MSEQGKSDGDWNKMDSFPRDRFAEVVVWNNSWKEWSKPVLCQWVNGIIRGIPDCWHGHPMRWAYPRAMPSRPHSNEFRAA